MSPRPMPRVRRSAFDQTEWLDASSILVQRWTCGFCDRRVSSEKGWNMTTQGPHGRVVVGAVAICPNCDLPSFLADDYQMPPKSYGSPVEHVPAEVAALYAEACEAMTGGAPTAAAMVGRKLLMNVAVSEGAEAGNTFRGYVNWLVEHEYVPVKAKEWVDEIRELGNDANHEIALMSPAAANELLEFVAMLLQLVYGYPERGRLSAKARKQAEAAANGTEG